ncbi:hypothetical protein DRE_02965 [Drechslerella stenobrocha 248]|uniref:Protein kinase domain-containing protein n=1 Tax=Drechslerella stenobrocha 248 TaxID=1043628 RepID=W7IF94_9PEZI|nr:hypothetical protein DRE_02965 [Drechslerella stenobrocha 248]
MAGVELFFGIVGLVDVALRAGDKLIQVASSFRGAESQLSALAVRIQGSWLRTKYQLEFLPQVAPLMGEDLQRNQKDILEKLNGVLLATTSHIERIVVDHQPHDANGPIEIRRLQYALTRDKLEKSVEELESWQQRFDYSWYLTMATAGPGIDERLASMNETRPDPARLGLPLLRASRAAAGLRSARQEDSGSASVFRSLEKIDHSSIQRIEESSAFIAQRVDSPQQYILDHTPLSSQQPSSVLVKRFRDLGRKLMNADPGEFNLLHCKGVTQRRNDANPHIIRGFTFIFEVPRGLSDPRGLRSLLTSAGSQYTLSSRLKIAKDLARAVNYLHMFGYVHKNIRAENVIVFQGNEPDICSAFLVGFDEARHEDAHSGLMGDQTFENNIYRHPDRQGPGPREYYIMQHDIYSLGVCLLEIGLCTAITSLLQDIESMAFTSYRQQSTFVKNVFLRETRQSLPNRMGTTYSKVVETCLTCLDPGNQDFGDETAFQDEDGVLVLEQLETINM